MRANKSRPEKTDAPFTGMFLEALEPRIAPASLTGIDYKAITVGSPQLLHAGEGLGTSDASGSYILAVEKGQALVFTTDLNGNGRFDPNEITGIAAGDGLKLTSFVDIHGDIVTNLKADGTLSDSDNDASNGKDGLVLLNSKIDGITLRSVETGDLALGDTVSNHLIYSNYSIYGSIYAGSGIGTSTSNALTIDTVGLAAQVTKFHGTSADYQVSSVIPGVGSIKTGTAAGGQFFSFGYKTVDATPGHPIGELTGGTLKAFTPGIGQAGGDIIGVKVGDGAASEVINANGTIINPATLTAFTIDGIVAGNGGIGAKGGDIKNVSLMGDTGGLRIVAGDGGYGISGGAGGSILNLSDHGSVDGNVEIRTGDGGEGFLGSAGAAGTLSFGTFQMNGNVHIGLGRGGDALGNAGNGTSLISGAIQPTDEGGLSNAVAVVSSFHDIGDIGSMKLVDFNKDGYTDIVYLTNSPDQLAVKFGTATGIDDTTPTLYFASPSYQSLEDGSSPIVVADFNGDGFLDIATASSVADSTDAIRVFLNPGGVADGVDGFGSHNGWAQMAKLTDGGNYVDSYVRSSLPSLSSVGLLDSGAAVTDITAGDFNGDGVMDLAYVSHGYYATISGAHQATSIVMLTGIGDGRLFADFGYDRVNDIQTKMPVLDGIADPDVISLFNGNHGEVVIHATAADTSLPVSPTNPEVLVAIEAANGLHKSVHLAQYVNADVNDDSVIAPNEYKLKTVASGTPKYDVAKFNDAHAINGWDTKDDKAPLGFTITDVGGDGIFDVVTLNQGQTITVLQGALGGVVLSDVNPTEILASFASTQGVILTGDQTLLTNAHMDNVDFKGVVAGNFGGASDAQFALYTNGTTPTATAFYQFDLAGFALHGPATYTADLTFNSSVEAPHPGNAFFNEKIIAFDIYDGNAASTQFGYVSAMPTTTKLGNFGIGDFGVTSITGYDFYISANKFLLKAGDGGTSYLGTGGAGGVIGSGSVSTLKTSTEVVGAFTIILPEDKFAQPDVSLVAGTGGSGFVNGGAGGGMRGIKISYTADTSLFAAEQYLYAGDGGAGLTGSGGVGGSLSSLSIMSGREFVGGDGGFGFQGGKGGNVEGNVGVGGFTAYNDVVLINTGDGGLGITKGGAGGDVSSFVTHFPVLVGGVPGGYLGYYAGDGGDAVAGTAGAGGSILNSSPYIPDNHLAGPIILGAGIGGDGLTGGAGGSITNFQNISTIGTPVSVVSALAGNGGTGISGVGGKGGSISSFTASGTGIDGQYFLPAWQFNRVIAGDGGDSFGAAGGDGGSLSSVRSTSNSSAAAVAAGAGGDGLTHGGNGGSISGTTARAGAGIAVKVIAIAGSGGSAFGALSTAPHFGNIGDIAPILSLRAFGGVNGVGGNGGSITNFKQENSTACAVDLIAGNGGSTVNYGTSDDITTNAGKGGSVSGITLAGEAGRVDETVAIKSYETDPLTLLPYANGFVQDILRDTPSTQLDDTVGNVGVVVGQAGRVKATILEPDGAPGGDAGTKTGSVTNFTARSIMSMVAGSVDRIAAINTISGITLTDAGGVLGAYKTTPVPAGPNHSEILPIYYSGPNQTGALVSSAPVGGSLADGVILVQHNNSGLTGPRLQ